MQRISLKNELRNIDEEERIAINKLLLGKWRKVGDTWFVELPNTLHHTFSKTLLAEHPNTKRGCSFLKAGTDRCLRIPQSIFDLYFRATITFTDENNKSTAIDDHDTQVEIKALFHKLASYDWFRDDIRHVNVCCIPQPPVSQSWLQDKKNKLATFFAEQQMDALPVEFDYQLPGFLTISLTDKQSRKIIGAQASELRNIEHFITTLRKNEKRLIKQRKKKTAYHNLSGKNRDEYTLYPSVPPEQIKETQTRHTQFLIENIASNTANKPPEVLFATKVPTTLHVNPNFRTKQAVFAVLTEFAQGNWSMNEISCFCRVPNILNVYNQDSNFKRFIDILKAMKITYEFEKYESQRFIKLHKDDFLKLFATEAPALQAAPPLTQPVETNALKRKAQETMAEEQPPTKKARVQIDFFTPPTMTIDEAMGLHHQLIWQLYNSAESKAFYVTSVSTTPENFFNTQVKIDQYLTAINHYAKLNEITEIAYTQVNFDTFTLFMPSEIHLLLTQNFNQDNDNYLNLWP